MHLVNIPSNYKAPVIATTVREVQSTIKRWRKSSNKVAFVPTMGHLHQGHLALVEAAYNVAERVVVSIFVNPAQFGEDEDFGTYPRTFDEDMAKLAKLGVDMIFAPATEVIYPSTADKTCIITVPELSSIIEGQFRPSFFTGVATVVNKLFNIVMPDIAVFGEKDYQQLLVIQKMVTDLVLPIKVLPVATVREADGLAMSSRNSYLQPNERQQANGLYQVLQKLVVSIQVGEQVSKAEENAIAQLQKMNFVVDYICVRQQNTLLAASNDDHQLVVLAAVHLGNTRLIDNIQFQNSK